MNFNNLIDGLRHGVSCALAHPQLSLRAASSLYRTLPVGCPGRQPAYLNAILLVECSMPVGTLLRHLKRVERVAGRRTRGLNAPRPLDLDIIDAGGRCIGQPRRRSRNWARGSGKVSGSRRRPRGWLTLPHPEMARRDFVLRPLTEIAPCWRHPVLKVSARQLLARLPRRPGAMLRVLDSRWISCETDTSSPNTPARAVSRG